MQHFFCIMGGSSTKSSPQISQLDIDLQSLENKWSEALENYIRVRRAFVEQVYEPRPRNNIISEQRQDEKQKRQKKAADKVKQDELKTAAATYSDFLRDIQQSMEILKAKYPNSEVKIDTWFEKLKTKEWNEIIFIYHDIADEDYTDAINKMLQSATKEVLEEAEQIKTSNSNIIRDWIDMHKRKLRL